MLYQALLSRTLLCLVLTVTSTSLLADTVWLKNGDRLTGTIKLFDGGKLLLQTDYGGAIALDWSKVKTLESQQPLLVKQSQYSGEVAKSLQASEAGKVTLVNGDAPRTVELASVAQLVRPRPVVTDLVWKGNIDAALDFQHAENRTDDYSLAFKTSARHDRWRHNAKGEYNRETQDDVVSTDNWSAEYALDYFLTERFYWDARVSYKRDRVEDLSRERAVGTGPGYQLWDDELGAFKVGGLLNRSDYEFSNGQQRSFYALAGTWDYNRYLLGKKFEFFTSGELGKPLSDVANYALEAEAGLRYKVTDWASLNVKAERDIISGSRNGDINKTRYTAGFGVTW